MLDLGDDHWERLKGGYRVHFDPRPALAKLEAGDEDAWSELWQGLYHQGEVDLASYAVVPHLVRIHRLRDVPDWNTYAMLGAIDTARDDSRNPSIPSWLASGYDTAWCDVTELALRDLERSDDKVLVQSALGVIAMARGLRPAGTLLLEFTEDELEEMISRCRGESS